MDGRTNGQPPLWAILDHQGRRLGWLARATGYSESHIWALKSGRFPITAAFRAKCAAALDLPVSVLFHCAPGDPPIGETDATGLVAAGQSADARSSDVSILHTRDQR